MQPLKRTPPVQTPLGHGRAIVAAPPPRGPGGRVGVAVGEDVDAGLGGVDQSLSLGGIITHCLVEQHSSESNINIFLFRLLKLKKKSASVNFFSHLRIKILIDLNSILHPDHSQ